jgi:hypothetical protein
MIFHNTMAQYHKFMKEWSNQRGMTSFFGSDKQEFLKDYHAFRDRGVRNGNNVRKMALETQQMGMEDVNRAEPVKERKTRKAGLVRGSPEAKAKMAAVRAKIAASKSAK